MKKLLYLLFLLPVLVFGQQQTINIGSTSNDGTGDPLRTAFTKTNANFTELYAGVVSYGSTTGTDNYLASVYPVPASYFTGKKFSVIFGNANTTTATINVNNLGVKTLKKNVTENLEAGDIIAGSSHIIMYDGTNFQVLTLGGVASVSWGDLLGNLSNQTDLQSALDAKQATLVSGTNIKTIESTSLLGSGDIDLTKSDVGLGNVDNTSDVSKPISTAVQTALDAKAAKLLDVDTKTDDYTLEYTTDVGILIEMNDATGNDVTVPLNATDPFEIGSTVTLVQKNTELLTVV